MNLHGESNFLELGGDSIMVVRILSEVMKREKLAGDHESGYVDVNAAEFTIEP